MLTEYNIIRKTMKTAYEEIPTCGIMRALKAYRNNAPYEHIIPRVEYGIIEVYSLFFSITNSLSRR